MAVIFQHVDGIPPASTQKEEGVGQGPGGVAVPGLGEAGYLLPVTIPPDYAGVGIPVDVVTTAHNQASLAVFLPGGREGSQGTLGLWEAHLYRSLL